MTAISVLIATGVVVLWALVASRLDRLRITAPMAMVVAGIVVGLTINNQIAVDLNTEVAQSVAELFLAVLLFVDATAVKGGYFGRDPGIAVRLLLLALPLSIVLAAGLGLLLMPGLSFAAVLAIACIVMPTDFAPATSAVHDMRMNERVRHILNVESGYNDGVVAPIFVFALTLAGNHEKAKTPLEALQTAVPAAVLALVVGVVIGVAAALSVNLTSRIGWTAAQPIRIAVVAIPLLTYSVAVLVGGNGFVAAFVCGIAYKAARKSADIRAELGLVDDISSLCGLALWFVFGIASVLVLVFGVAWQLVVLGVCALTVLRGIPVFLGLIRTDLTMRQRLAVSVIAPRGAASIVFGLLAFNAFEGDPADAALTVTVITVLGSVLLHGVVVSAIAARRPSADA